MFLAGRSWHNKPKRKNEGKEENNSSKSTINQIKRKCAKGQNDVNWAYK